jgi:hypothetical protein
MTTEATHAPSAKTNHGASSWGWLTVFAFTFWPAFLYFLGRRLGWAKPWRWVAALAPVALFVIIIIAAGSGSSGDTPSANPAPSSPAAAANPPAPPPPAANPPAPPPRPAAKAPSETVSQKNARESAESYLETGSFSRNGLIKQLSSQYGEGFSKADAIYAVVHINVNWNEQAAKAAKDYLDTGSFSRNGLIQQLSSRYGDSFTHAQAVYGVNQTGL